MRFLNRAIDRFCQKHRKFGIQRLMLYIVITSAVIYLINLVDNTHFLLSLLIFNPVLIMRGQVWRLVTWVFLPINPLSFMSGALPSDLFFTALSLYFYYFIGSTLEREWGTPKFTIFYISGVILNIIYGFVMYGFVTFIYLSPEYLNLSMFFAFAVLFPDFVIRLFFIIPLKIKWLALVNAAFFAYSIISGAISGNIFLAILPLVAILNFLIICGGDLLKNLRPLRARTSPRAISYKRASKKAQREHLNQPYRHKCSVCGKTDITSPDMQFRYCSRCEGYHCFCIDHISNHIHLK